MAHTQSGNVVHLANAITHTEQTATLFSPDFVLQIAALRDIAEISGDNLVLSGPVHPDFRLIALCAEALHLARQRAGIRSNYNELLRETFSAEERRQRFDAIRQADRALYGHIGPILRRAGKIQANSAAGVFAKALLVAGAVDTPGLGTSLANDLIRCEGLRESLTWPASPRSI